MAKPGASPFWGQLGVVTREKAPEGLPSVEELKEGAEFRGSRASGFQSGRGGVLLFEIWDENWRLIDPAYEQGGEVLTDERRKMRECEFRQLKLSLSLRVTTVPKRGCCPTGQLRAPHLRREVQATAGSGT